MRKYLLLIMFIAATAFTYVSCGPKDDQPKQNFVNIALANDYLSVCPDIHNLYYTVSVYEINSNGSWEEFQEYNGAITSTNFSIPHIQVPYRSRIKVTLASNDCTSCCSGSCSLPAPISQAGYAVFTATIEYTYPDSADYTPLIILDPQVSDCL